MVLLAGTRGKGNDRHGSCKLNARASNIRIRKCYSSNRAEHVHDTTPPSSVPIPCTTLPHTSTVSTTCLQYLARRSSQAQSPHLTTFTPLPATSSTRTAAHCSSAASTSLGRPRHLWASHHGNTRASGRMLSKVDEALLGVR
jgi:hypothetical protein